MKPMNRVELAHKIGVQPTTISSWFRTGPARQEHYGFVIERKARDKKNYDYFLISEPEKRVIVIQPGTAPKPSNTTECDVCGGPLSPRRAIVLNHRHHCSACNKKAFVDGCRETRKALGLPLW